MNKKAAERIVRAAVAVLVGASVFWWAPVMPASRVQASSCAHENCEWVTMVKPTCSKPGKEVMICQDCEEILETEEIEKTEHKGKWEKTQEPTCAHEGVRSYVCKNCRFVIKTEAIPVKNHRFIWKTTVKATCGGNGIRQQVCKNCGATGKSESVSSKKRHKYGSWSIESIEVKGRTVKVSQKRICTACGKDNQAVKGTTAAFSGKHNTNKFYYKYTPKTGRIVVLCSECHKSVTGKITGGKLEFTKPKKDNSKYKSKGWKMLRR